MGRLDTAIRSGELSLVLGVDGSGKTSFMNGVAEATGATVLEVASSQKLSDFKHATFDEPITPELVDAREQLFEGLNHEFDAHVQEALKRSDVLTSGSLLVTRLSHLAMRETIARPAPTTVVDIVEEWLDGAELVPDTVVHLHAPADVIRARLLKRELRGDVHERPRGYNSLFFLARYEKALQSATSYLANTGIVKTFDYDSSRGTSADKVSNYLTIHAAQ